ncbi:MAG TPA: DUF5336 domain-containing protein [Mycobacteriales bacterium]|nr:DUF5336 domain-containing protein [Mycobacteriales bacterium]
MSQSSPMPDLKSLPPFDLGVLATGLLAFIFSFFPYYGVKVSGSVLGINVSTFGQTSSTVTAWHSYSTLALLLILLGTIVAAIAIFASSSAPSLPIGLRWIAAGLCALGALLYLIRLFTLPHHHHSFGAGISASEGVKWGGYLLLIIVLLNAACAVISALSSEEQVPWHQFGAAGAGGAAPMTGGPAPMGGAPTAGYSTPTYAPPPAPPAPPMQPPAPPAQSTEPSAGDDPAPV